MMVNQIERLSKDELSKRHKPLINFEITISSEHVIPTEVLEVSGLDHEHIVPYLEPRYDPRDKDYQQTSSVVHGATADGYVIIHECMPTTRKVPSQREEEKGFFSYPENDRTIHDVKEDIYTLIPANQIASMREGLAVFEDAESKGSINPDPLKATIRKTTIIDLTDGTSLISGARLSNSVESWLAASNAETMTRKVQWPGMMRRHIYNAGLYFPDIVPAKTAPIVVRGLQDFHLTNHVSTRVFRSKESLHLDKSIWDDDSSAAVTSPHNSAPNCC